MHPDTLFEEQSALEICADLPDCLVLCQAPTVYISSA
jgi:hypothetical protein